MATNFYGGRTPFLARKGSVGYGTRAEDSRQGGTGMVRGMYNGQPQQKRNFSALNQTPEQKRYIVDQSYLRNNLLTPTQIRKDGATSMQQGGVRGVGDIGAKPTSAGGTPPNHSNNLLNYILSPEGKGMAQGLLESSGYSTMPVGMGQALARGMARSNEAQKYEDASKFKQKQFDFKKSQATINNLLTSQGLDIELQKMLKPKLSSFAIELNDLGIPLDSPEAKELFLQKLEGAKTEINLNEKTDALFKSKFYENTLLKNTNDLNEKSINNEDMRKTYQQMSLLIRDGVSTGIIDSTFLDLKRLARDLGIVTKEQAETISQQELFQKLSNFTVPRMRVAGSGATSNFEAELFKDATATLTDDESTNKIIIQSRLSALNLQREYADFYNQFMSNFNSDSKQKDFTNRKIGDAFREYINEYPNILSNLVGVEENKIIASEKDLSNKITNGSLKAGDMIFSNDTNDNSYNSFTILNDDIINQYLK
jgi:hypothetical protein